MIPMEGWKDQLLKILVVALLGGYIVAQGGLSWAYSTEGLSGSGISPTLMGQEYNSVNHLTVDLHYGPGFAYGNAYYLSTHDSNFIDVYLASSKIVNSWWPDYEPVEYQVMMWYGNAIHSTTDPPSNLIGISDIRPRGYVTTGGYITRGVSYQLSSGASVGVGKLLELGAEQTFGLSWSSTVPTGYYIDIDTNKEGYTYTAEQIREDVQKKICESDDTCVVLGGGNDWILRYAGAVKVTKDETFPTTLRFLISTRTQNSQAEYVDNTLRDRPLIVLFAVAKYKSTNTWITWDDFKVRGITFILGDNDQAGGDDGYLWYYRVDKITTFS
ncbi:hypothetical protein [Thermococcus sp. Bubb.Bath]|uniref:hypothetical protein n=1 Tax=Thermococcus sp. Bubb.Bath TaxID=1638242 RepID=UPI001439BAA2|nr:hypothetical protein [Thermococcus sp. Bubb.Bath]NJF24320.1 hypothetical protein [Thermococcus sp. Bubb.Bath]